MKTEIRLTADGSSTLYVPQLNEHYHSVHGAIQESNHVFIQAGLRYSTHHPVRIFEVGFGTGLNVLLTAIEAVENGLEVVYHSIEQFPLDSSILQNLNYQTLIKHRQAAELYKAICEAEWDKEICITASQSMSFRLKKVYADICSYTYTSTYNLVYFDAFAPDKQADIWQEKIFENLSSAMETNAIFVTYSSKGDVKRALRKFGFNVKRLQGPPGKRDMIRAIFHPIEM